MTETPKDPRSDFDWLNVVADPVRLQIVKALATVPAATTTELAQVGSSSKPTLRRHLDALIAFGVVHRHASRNDGAMPGRPPERFSLARNVRPVIRSIFEI